VTRCPICREEVAKTADFRPFCSERCRRIDLGNWLDGTYRIAAEDDDGAPEPHEDPACD
jgi:endogenous inhibitor of DNA gyrase (YacG/DUF329 family)